MKNIDQTPFLKWPGGKRWFINKYKDYFPENYRMYVEPFLGSGAVFFSLNPSKAILSDVNEELINLYVIMRDRPEELKKQLILHQKKHNSDYYYNIRKKQYIDSLERAGRMLYLNRTCYNGMYRVNGKGIFNVPIGTKNNLLYDIEEFMDYANSMKNVDLKCCDYSETIEQAQSGDLIFADPPYATTKNTNFVKYNDEYFRWEDQLKLHELLTNAKERGAFIVLTNVYCKDIIDMYKKDGFFVHIVKRSSNIAGDPKKRGQVKELMITSFRKPRRRNEKNE